jgi:hypothetical protein
MFEKIRFSYIDVMLDPIISLFVPLASCKNYACRKRAKVLQKSNDRFAEELDLVAILQKIRDSYGMLKFLRGKEHKTYLNYSKGRVIDMSSEDEKDKDKSMGDEDSNRSSGDCLEDFDETHPNIYQLKDSFKHLIVQGLHVDKKFK